MIWLIVESAAVLIHGWIPYGKPNVNSKHGCSLKCGLRKIIK